MRILLVGPSHHFQSGISTYTMREANALRAAGHDVSLILIRHLLPKRLFPGRARVGDARSALRPDPDIPAYDSLDYHRPASWRAARRFLREQAPDVVVLQWWTAAATHLHRVVASAARRAGIPVVAEMHEVMDMEEAGRGLLRTYARWFATPLLAHCDGHVVHSEADRTLVAAAYGLDASRVVVVPHARYDHFGDVVPRGAARAVLGVREKRVVLCFGLVRRYKGVPVLVDAFERMPERARRDTRLLLVGEVWDDARDLVQRIADSPCADAITLVDEYVPDDQVAAYFSAADVVALPYLRASQSGVAQIALTFPCRLVVTRVGGLPEALGDDAGISWVEAGDADGLATSIAAALAAGPLAAPVAAGVTWSDTAKALAAAFRRAAPHEARDTARTQPARGAA